MSNHHDKKSKKHSHEHGHRSKSKGGAKNGLFIAAVVLMLVGMAIYVATMDEEIQPGGDPGENAPAAADE
ncbi:unnamed protein product [marine sediment metagenome]|uniref:Uncharacterized protein n=1 Tax=marine sediment metagenome TaxID=412755 RepID=X0S5L4_9ZZZZ